MKPAGTGYGAGSDPHHDCGVRVRSACAWQVCRARSVGISAGAMNNRIDDRDLSAFLVYASRERSLDASLRAANRYGRSDEHRRSIDALRELNKKMLFRETRRNTNFF